MGTLASFNRVISFIVEGVPVQQGSKRPIQTKAKGGYKGGLRVMDVNAKTLKPWRALVRESAETAMGGASPLSGPVHATIVFVFPRPKYHAKMTVKPSWKTSKPDLDKLERAIYDSLSGVVYDDDAQVVQHHNTKCYGDRPMVNIIVSQMREQ